MSIKFLIFLRGGLFWVVLGGGSADFICMGAGIFLKYISSTHPVEQERKGATGGKMQREKIKMIAVWSSLVGKSALISLK